MTLQEHIKEIISLAKNYTIEEYEFTKLKITLKTSIFLSSLAKKTILGLFAIIALSFISIGVAFWMGALLEQVSLGFLLVGAFYLLVVLILFFNRKHIENYVVKKLTTKYF